MVFCNPKYEDKEKFLKMCHNPYFNRWFSAMKIVVFIIIV